MKVLEGDDLLLILSEKEAAIVGMALLAWEGQGLEQGGEEEKAKGKHLAETIAVAIATAPRSAKRAPETGA